MARLVVYSFAEFDSPSTTGGIRRLKELISGFLKEGHEVHLLGFSPGPFKGENFHFHKLSQSKIPLISKGLGNLIVNLSSLRKINSLEANFIIVFEISYAIQLVVLNVKNIVTFIRQDFIGYRNIKLDKNRFVKRIYLNLLKVAEKYAILGSIKVVVQSMFESKIILNRHPSIVSKLEKRIVIVNNNVNPSWISSNGIEPIREYSAKKPYKICFLGNLDNKIKGLHLLLPCFERLISQGIELNLTVIGGGKLLDTYKQRFQENSKIKFIGNHPYPLEILKAQHLLVVPSLHDSFPNTIMEAFYTQIAVIGSNVGGIPEMINNSELLFEPNEESLYQKLCHCLNERTLVMFRSNSIKRKKELTFDWVKEVYSTITS